MIGEKNLEMFRSKMGRLSNHPRSDEAAICRRSSTVGGVDLFKPGKDQHDLPTIAGVAFRRVVGRTPEGVVFKVDRLKLFQWRQMVQVVPVAYFIVVALQNNRNTILMLYSPDGKCCTKYQL